MRHMRRLLLFTTVFAVLALPAAAHGKTFYGTVGPTRTITLKRADGTIVRRISAGLHKFVIRDRSARHNFHLLGGGLHKRTRVVFVGTRTWTGVRIRRGVTYTYFCEPHPDDMTRTFRGV
jgi:hypothetical protein